MLVEESWQRLIEAQDPELRKVFDAVAGNNYLRAKAHNTTSSNSLMAFMPEFFSRKTLQSLQSLSLPEELSKLYPLIDQQVYQDALIVLKAVSLDEAMLRKPSSLRWLDALIKLGEGGRPDEEAQANSLVLTKQENAIREDEKSNKGSISRTPSIRSNLSHLSLFADDSSHPNSDQMTEEGQAQLMEDIDEERTKSPVYGCMSYFCFKLGL